jgi:hypothetical protein
MSNFAKRITAVILLALGVGLVFWQHGEPRRAALEPVANLARVLTKPGSPDLLDAVVVPGAIRDRSSAEQQQFLEKALSDEVSPEGVLALKRHAEFGTPKSLFPNEAAVWSHQAGVNADDCVAFKMQRAGIRAEVVLRREGQAFRVVRCNNVKQMAGGI